MNLTSTDPTAPPPPPPPQPPRSSFSCDRHPTEQFNGFCPSCLCERLTTLDNNSSTNTPSSSRRPSSASAAAAAAIKTLFSSTAKPYNFPPPPPALPKPSKSYFPELRRTKSFSASKNEALLGLNFEPQRKSCDVRARNTLWGLFTLDDENKFGAGDNKSAIGAAASSSQQNPQISKIIGSSVANKPVFEETENENEEDFIVSEINAEQAVVYDDYDDDDDGGDEIRSVRDSQFENSKLAVEIEVNSSEIVEEDVVNVSNVKMKEHIDLDTHEKKSSGGGFWAAASVFSKKWHKWRRKQKLKKQNNGESFATLPVEKPISRQFRETQSEIADYGFGRRSCDTDPRFSLDAARISFDDARYSFDEPRASWDGGYLFGRSLPRMAPMVSVMEDGPGPSVPVSRADMQIPVEEPLMECGGESLPGGSLQTKEYYSDSSSSRRRKSLDRSSSIRKTAAAVVAEIDELKVVSNAKVSPATADGFRGAKVVVGERDLRELRSNSIRDDCCDSFELGSGDRDSGNSLIGGGNGDRKERKKSRRWSWRIWGFIHRRNGGNNKDEDEEEKCSRVNGVERCLSESWQDLRTEGNGDVRGRLNRNVFRSNSSVSWRNGNQIGGLFGSMRKSSVDINGNGNGNRKKRKDEFVLEKNRSARHSPNHVDNGLLRFYLTPMRGSRRGGTSKIKPNNSHSIARSVLRLY